jgi:dTDP-4-amino-4,6-dideoxygalactose transaminase
VATAEVIALLGLTPVLVDVNPDTFDIDIAAIEKAITPKTKAIVPVHLFGQCANMEALLALAKKHNLFVIEDTAQALGSDYFFSDGTTKKAGTIGTVGCTSFFPSKNLGCLGDGGAVVTNEEDLNKVIRALRNYGSEKKYVNDYLGINSRLDEIQAAFLKVKLPNLANDNQKRRQIAHRYLAEIKNDKIVLPFYDGSTNHVFHLFVIRTEKRTELQNYLKENGIETMIHYPIPPHQQKALQQFNAMSFPITEKIHREVLSLPMSPVLTEEEVSRIIHLLNSFN